jgi:hypothetical protein
MQCRRTDLFCLSEWFWNKHCISVAQRLSKSNMIDGVYCPMSSESVMISFSLSPSGPKLPFDVNSFQIGITSRNLIVHDTNVGLLPKIRIIGNLSFDGNTTHANGNSNSKSLFPSTTYWVNILPFCERSQHRHCTSAVVIFDARKPV